MCNKIRARTGKRPLKRNAVVVVFWAAVEHIVDYLLSTLCRRTAVSSLLAGVPAVADRIAVEPPDRVHNKNSSLGMWQKLGCDKNGSWHWWQWYKQLWYGSCLAASFSAAVIIGVCVIVYARTKTTSYYSPWFVPFIGEQLHCILMATDMLDEKSSYTEETCRHIASFQSNFSSKREWVVGGRMECPDEIGKFTNPIHQKVKPLRLNKLMTSLLPWLKKMQPQTTSKN